MSFVKWCENFEVVLRWARHWKHTPWIACSFFVAVYVHFPLISEFNMTSSVTSKVPFNCVILCILILLIPEHGNFSIWVCKLTSSYKGIGGKLSSLMCTILLLHIDSFFFSICDRSRRIFFLIFFRSLFFFRFSFSFLFWTSWRWFCNKAPVGGPEASADTCTVYFCISFHHIYLHQTYIDQCTPF